LLSEVEVEMDVDFWSCETDLVAISLGIDIELFDFWLRQSRKWSEGTLFCPLLFQTIHQKKSEVLK